MTEEIDYLHLALKEADRQAARAEAGEWMTAEQDALITLAAAYRAVVPAPPAPTVFLTLDGTWELTPDEVWPDGAPDTWDASDVANQIRKSHGFSHFLHTWELEQGATVEIAVHGDDKVTATSTDTVTW